MTGAPYIYKCTHCGKETEPRSLETANAPREIRQTMCREKTCFECAYWVHVLGNLGCGHYIIKGRLYLCAPFKEGVPENPLDEKRRRTYILPDNGAPRCVEIAQDYGEIPSHFGVADTARIISLWLYFKIRKRHRYRCNKRGCYDRYHCYWYHTEDWEKDGPWNKIPSWHKPGWEQCPLFIDKTEF